MNAAKKTFNFIVRGKKSNSTFLHYHSSAVELFLAKITTLRIGIILYLYDKVFLGKHLRNLKSQKGSKSHLDALVVANGPSCNRINFEFVRKLNPKAKLRFLASIIPSSLMMKALSSWTTGFFQIL